MPVLYTLRMCGIYLVVNFFSTNDEEFFLQNKRGSFKKKIINNGEFNPETQKGRYVLKFSCYFNSQLYFPGKTR